MSTEWRDENDELVAVTRWGGRDRGCLVELEVETAEWEQVETVTSERGEVLSRSELEQRGTVVEWSRLRARSRVVALRRVARRWSDCGEDAVAASLNSAAAEVAQQNRVR